MGLYYSFVDEEVEEELNSSSSTESGTSPVLVSLEEDKVMVFDIWARSGNVAVGYGYIVNYEGARPTMEMEVFCVVLLDDEGYAIDYWYDDSREVDKMKIQEFIEKSRDVLSNENIQDLSNALNGLRKAIFERIDEPIWKPVVEGAVVGGVGGLMTGGLGAAAAAAGGAITGAISGLLSWFQKDKWHEREYFFSNLLIEGGLSPPL